MSDSSSQNKTEKATGKRKRDARKKGQIPRSREVVNFAVLFASATLLFVMGNKMYTQYDKVLSAGFVLHGTQALNTEFILHKAFLLIRDGFIIFAPIPITILVAVYLGNISLGGQVFSLEKLTPKLSNINPIEGIRKIFSLKGATDLLQSLLKCLLIFITTYFILKGLHPKLLQISLLPLHEALSSFGHSYLLTFFFLSACTIIILFIDVPFQLFQYQKKLRMSKQEIKDEFKQTEGNPQIKGRMRRLQRNAAKRRKMLKEVPNANLIITNPTHFSVALKYEEETMDAPIILAMGADLMAMHIRRLSTEHSIPVLQIPLLARALYYNGEVGDEIPEALFHAVAQVIAYLYQLDDPLNFYLQQSWIEQLPIPDDILTEEMKHGK